MKKYKAIVSQKIEIKNSKKIQNKNVYKSISFKFFAKNFQDAVLIAEKHAKKTMLFNAIKIAEV